MTLKKANLGVRGCWENGTVGSTRNPSYTDNSYTGSICLV